MKKNVLHGQPKMSWMIPKTIFVLKLVIIILFATSLQVKANPDKGQRFNMNLRQTEIRQVLKYKTDFSLQNLSISKSFDQLFTSSNLIYNLLDNNEVTVFSTNKAANDKIKVTGRVTGANGEAIAGASVQQKGSGIGASTDNSGNYTLIVNNDATLLITSIGYEPQEVKVSGRSVIDIKLVVSFKEAEEVVVIGYGTANKRDLTGSIVKISGKDIADKPNTNPVASLQGRVAGLSVVNNGTPGSAPDIRIRGTVSIGQVHPLYVVDGIFNDNIDYLNANDIESIEILKDPSSLAIFGVKGATGVIAITTKKAKVGQVTVNFNTTYGFKKLVDKIKLANSDQFNLLFAEENANNGVATPNYSALTANTDWINAVTRTGKFNTNNLSISGATEKNRFNLGFGYIADEGIIKHEKLERMTLSFSDEFKLNKAIKIGVTLNASRQNNPFGAGGVLDNARKTMPQISADTKNFRVANPYGGDSLNADIYSGLNVALQNSGVINPLLEIENTWNKQVNIENRTVGSVYGEVNFLKYFTFRSTFYADISNVNNRQYSPLYYAYRPQDTIGSPKKDSAYLYNSKTQLSEDDNTYRKFQQDHILTFKKSFGDHNLTATAGITTYYFSNFNRNGLAKPFSNGNALPIPDDKRFWYISTQFNDPATTLASSSQSEYATASVLGRLLYNYRGKYFLNASLRDDGSSQIPTKNRHQKFWALGTAWDISKEKFMQPIRGINFLKLKASIGVLGNQTASYLDGNPINYPFYPNLNTGTSAVFGTTSYFAAVNAYEPSPDLKWETVQAQEVGVELNAFNNHLHFEANYFNKTTKDLMTYVDRSTQGLKAILENGGSIRNWGEEFSVSWNQNINKDLTINIASNITFLQNKVISVNDKIPAGYLSRAFQNNGSAESRTQPGLPIGSFYGYVVEGLYQSYADILKSPVASAIGAYGPGDFKFKDVNGDGKITADDRTVIGNPTPKFTYGASVNVNYKNFNLGVDMGGVYGNQVFRTWGSLESPFQRVNYSAEKIDRWHGEGTSNWVPIISQGHRFNYNGSTYNIEDGSYFRIRNIQLGYNFAQRLISKATIKNLRVFANIQNPKTWKNNLGYTAEFGGGATAFGYDNAGGAIPVVTTFGLNVTF